MISVLYLKLVAIVVVTGGSILFGILPGIFNLGSRFHGSLLLSSLLCFGGGILLSTTLIHILPETKQNLKGWAEITFCGGFMFIYLADVVLNLIQECKRNSDSLHVTVDNLEQSSYEEIAPLLPVEDIGGVPDFKCANFGLIAAFSLHSLLEGLVIGVEPTTRGVLLLLLAVCCHKLLVAFCLGCELSSDGRSTSTWDILPALAFFSVMSGAGIGLGCIIQPNRIPSLHIIVPALQAVAGGTLLYVVMCEILPRERDKAKDLPIFSSLFQYLAVLCGFSFMTSVTLTTG